MRRLLAGSALLALGFSLILQDIQLSDAMPPSQRRILPLLYQKSGYSLVLASASSQYLSATGKTGINQQKFYFNIWWKTITAAVQFLFYFGDGSANNYVEVFINASGQLRFTGKTAGTVVFNLITSASFADGNWHNGGFAMDTTQATANNRGIIWADNIQAALGTNTQPSQNSNLSNNYAATYTIGASNGGSLSSFFNGKLAQAYGIDGQGSQQITPAMFITGTPGAPKTYSGAYTGVFDFFLPFSNAGAPGTDSSGEHNNWTPQNSPTQSTDYP